MGDEGEGRGRDEEGRWIRGDITVVPWFLQPVKERRRRGRGSEVCVGKRECLSGTRSQNTHLCEYNRACFRHTPRQVECDNTPAYLWAVRYNTKGRGRGGAWRGRR